VLVNATAAGLTDGDAFATLPLHPDDLGRYATVVDLVYRPGGTALVAAARERGVAAVDGLEVLVRQGALSLERWTGRPAPLDVMRAAARAADG
jgi:shikimate dehydrogenase